MKQIFTLALLSAIIAAKSKDKSDDKSKDKSDDAEFMEFTAKNNKQYKDAKEFGTRKDNFEVSSKKVKNLNAKGG
jgi:hypothetical protein